MYVGHIILDILNII